MVVLIRKMENVREDEHGVDVFCLEKASKVVVLNKAIMISIVSNGTEIRM